jgi:hypothetical protein
MTNLGLVKNLLGIQIKHLPNGRFFLHQTKYIQDLVTYYRMDGAKAIDIPIVQKVIVSNMLSDQKEYQHTSGQLIWPTVGC